MVKGKIKLFSVFCVAAALCLIPALSDAAEDFRRQSYSGQCGVVVCKRWKRTLCGCFKL